MPSSQEEQLLGGVFDSLTGIIPNNTAETVVVDSTGTNLNQLINDHIFGLLTQKSLTPSQVALLAALLQVKD